MDDTQCQSFFRQPTQALQRRYEALRAFFIDQRPLPEIAAVTGYSYGTLRNLVTDFRAQCRAGQVPPFSLNHGAVGRPAAAPHPRPHYRTRSPSPTVASSPWPPVSPSAAAWQASFFSSPCWPSSVSTRSSLRPAIQARA